MVAYQEGDWNLALAEFRTARRLSGSHHLLPYLVDCERALGRPEKALDLARSPEAATLGTAERAELMIVRSGIRRDMGQGEAALTELEGPHLVPGRPEPWAARIYYAYADALLELGRVEQARKWFTAAAEGDPDLTTDAWERLDDLDGTVHVDLLEGEEDEDDAPEGEVRDHADHEGRDDERFQQDRQDGDHGEHYGGDREGERSHEDRAHDDHPDEGSHRRRHHGQDVESAGDDAAPRETESGVNDEVEPAQEPEPSQQTSTGSQERFDDAAGESDPDRNPEPSENSSALSDDSFNAAIEPESDQPEDSKPEAVEKPDEDTTAQTPAPDVDGRTRE